MGAFAILFHQLSNDGTYGEASRISLTLGFLWRAGEFMVYGLSPDSLSDIWLSFLGDIGTFWLCGLALAGLRRFRKK